MKRLFLPFMALFLLIGGTMRAQQELTVYADGNANSQYVPAYMSYFDDFSKSQVVIPAADLSEMSGGTISSMKFYVNSNTTSSNIPYTTVSTVDVYLMEVDYTSISAFEPKENGTIVYTGTLDVASGAKDDVGSLTISFSTPYSYNGGNLLIGIENTTDVNYKFIYFSGTTVNGASIAGSNGSATGTIPATQRNFIPKTTFTYTAGGQGGDEPQDIPDEYFYISASGWAMWDAAPESYPEEPTCVIDEIEITGFTVPEDGEENDIDLVAGDDNYTIITAEWYEYNSFDPMSEGEVFTAGYTYYMVIQVAIDDECSLADGYTVTINGSDAVIDPTYTSFSDGVLTLMTIDYEIDEDPGQEPLYLVMDFEDGMGDWTMNNCHGSTGISSAYTAHGGSYAFRFYYTSNYPQYLISPVLDDNDGGNFSFYYARYSNTYPETFKVGYSTTTNDPTAFTWGNEETCTNGYTVEYLQYSYDFPAGTKYVAIACTSDDQFYLFIDDIVISGDAKKATLASNSNKQAIAHNGKKHEVMKAIKANSRIEFIAPNFWGAKGNRDGEDMFVSYNLYLDGNLVAEGITDLDYYMQEAENFTDGSSHIAKIEAVYESGATLDMTKAWTFQSGDHFTGAPEGLAVNVEGTTANLSWELPEAGLGVTDLFYDFEDGSLGDLTSLNANNDSKYWIATMSYPNYTYEGSGMAMVSYAAPNDDYLITPQIRPTEGSVFSFYANNDGGSSYPETFEVMVSTTGMEAADFTPITDMITISGSYQLFEYGLGDYAGQDIYLAIHNVSDDMDIMCVDNMSITSVEAEMNHVGAVVYRDGEIVAKLRNGETSYTEELEGSDIPTYCISIIQNGSKDAGVYYALAEKQCVEQVVVACQAPYDLAAVADGSDVTLTWNMDGEKPVLLFDDFEDGALTNWTTIDADGDGETWENATPASYGIGDAYSGTNCASSWSWNSYTLYPDNYMISPLVEGAVQLHYYVATNTAYPDHYGVYASTTGIDTTDFVLLFEETAGNSKGGVEGAVRSSKTQPVTGTREMSSWIEKTIDLPEGTKYVAFRHWNSDDMNYLFIDDVTIYGEEIPTTATYNIYSSTDGENYTILAAGVEGTTYTDEDLEPGTYYYQVTANNVVATGDCESEPALAENGDDNFVMVEIEGVEPCVAPINLSAEIYGSDNSIIVVWDFEEDVIVMGSNVYRSTDGVNYELIAELTNGDASYLDENLEPGTYYYQVTSTNMLSDQSYCESDPALALETQENFVMIEIGTPQPQTCETPINLVATVEGDDVTLTWEMPGQGGGDVETYFTFDTDLQGWINIDANNDGRLWFHSSQHPDYDYSGLDAEGGDGFLVSASYEDGTGSSFQANNYIYAPYRYTIASGSQFNFAYDYGSDDYPDFFAVVVSTVDNPTSANDFVEIWTVDAKNATSNKAAKRHAQGTRYQNWQQVTVDLSEYAGQQIWIGFHHSDYDEYEVWIDNVEITNATKDGGDVTFNIYRSEDGVDYELIAEGVTDLSFIDEDLENGTYYYQVTSVTDECESVPAEVEAEVNVQEPTECATPINLVATVNDDDVTLTWEMPGQGGGDAGQVTIGDPNTTTNSSYLPAYSLYNYALSQQIYTADEIGTSGTISALTMWLKNTSSYAREFNIYMKEVSESSFADGNSWVSLTSADLVGTATLDNGISDYTETTINLSAPFNYSGEGNLLICVQDVTGNWSSGVAGLTVATTENQAIYHYRDGSVYDVTNPGVAGYLMASKDVVRLTIGEGGGANYTFYIYRSEDGDNYEPIAEGVTSMNYLDEDLDYGTYYYQVVTVTDVCESDPAEVSATLVEPVEICNAPFDLAATAEGNDVTLTWDYTPAGTTIYGFEDGEIAPWTTIDADGDGYAWYGLNTSTIPGHNGSVGLATSASYQGSALTPNNYLVSPQMTISDANNTMVFWACAQDSGYPSEHFGVAVSTTGNTSDADFTMLQEWTMTAKAQGNWYEYTVDLSAYDGQDIYVAIRHFDCTDFFRLNVDDISFTGTSDNTTFNVYRSTDGEEYELIAEGVDEMTYTDEDLDFGTYYYQVTANGVLSDGTDCESEPALDVDGEEDFVMVELIEPTYECIAAINLDATADGGSAILTWEMPTGESYEYDFEGGLNGWTTFEGADAESTWIHSDNNLGGYDYTTHAHSGTGFAVSYSFVDYQGEYQADNYLVSPVKYSIENGTTMTFFYDFANDSYADFFAVEVSTGSNNTAADFTEVWSTDGKKANGGNAIVRKVNGTRYDNWQEATIDLSAFAGQEVWIAFHHEDYDMYEVWIDDVTVGAGASAPLFNIYRSTDGENYELIAEGVEDMNYTDTGLSDGTYYYQVTSVLYDYDGEVACESDPALAVNGEDDFVMVTIDGIEDFSSLINVYPNPTRANVNIEAEGLSNIVVFNALGQVVYEVNATDDHVVVNMSNFGAGVYMFNIITNNGTTVKRVTVAK